jgi:hypothetical protein
MSAWDLIEGQWVMADAFLQRPKCAGVAFAHFAKGMAARFGPTARIC